MKIGRFLLVLVLLAGFACGDDDAPEDAGQDSGTDVPMTDVGVDARDAGPDISVPPVTVRPSEREDCADRNPMRNPYFGDLHVHTRYSFDAAAYDVRSGPADAYAFARGGEIGLPPYDAAGEPSRRYRLSRPLDFAAVTDHAELLDVTSICSTPGADGYDSETCESYRRDGPTGTYGDFIRSLLPGPQATPYCERNPTLCAMALDDVWEDTVNAAEAAYDRTSACSFTSFIGYEWTGSGGIARNLHRNIIFRTATSLTRPTSFVQANTPETLWDRLEEDCLESGTDCDLIVIPHNGNIGSGEMFVPITEDGSAYDQAFSERRAALEPLLEIYQHKGASECSVITGDPLSSEDEFCGFEQFFENFCSSPDEENCTPLCDIVDAPGFLGNGCVQPRDFARGALRTGLSELVRTGADPFRMGFIGSTDTHNATPGAVNESDWPGHTGVADDEAEDALGAPGDGINVRIRTSSPGGLAVVWADENSRPALFDAMRRRETYGTSGPRIVARFFGGWGYDDNLCDSPDFVATGYADGVPMGALLPDRTGDGAPTFAVRALADALGAPLQRIQIIKGRVDPATGETSESVFDVAGGENGASVDLVTCEPSGAGATDLCDVWTDPDFDPAEPAFYYARILENPTCRWSHYVCNEAAVDCDTVDPESNLASCCDPAFTDRSVQERAWTSPIWYTP